MNSIRILLIEDDFADAELTKIYLQDIPNSNLTVIHEATFYDALALLEEENFDLILMDLGLPDIEQPEGLKIMLNRAPDTPLVVLTGYEDEQRGYEAIRLGAQDLLTKDRYDSQSLQRSIRYAISRCKQNRRFKQNLEIYREVLRVSEIFYWTLNWEQKTMQWLPEMIEAFELDNSHRSDLEHFLETFHPEDRGSFKTVLQKAASENGIFSLKHRMDLEQNEGQIWLTKVSFSKKLKKITGTTQRL
jgi:DNA-binding response OmpR family regulator